MKRLLASLIILTLLAACSGVSAGKSVIVHPGTGKVLSIQSNRMTETDERPLHWVVLATADFDGDGREDQALGEPTKVQDAYRTIRVQGASGKLLFQVSSGQFFQSVRVAVQGFPTPILVTTQAAGNQYDVRSFMYEPGAGELQPLKWDGQAYASAQSVEFQPGALVLHLWGGEREIYRLQGGQLVRHSPASNKGSTSDLKITDTTTPETPEETGKNGQRSKQQSPEVTSVSFVDAEHGWMAEGSWILGTADGGRTWKRLHDTKTTHQVYAVQLVTKNQGWYANGDGLFATLDGGETWEKLLDASFLYGRFQFADERHGWVRLYPRELKATQDGGKTWVAVDNPCQQGGLFSFIDPHNGWMVCATDGGAGIETKKLYKTGDGGRTWNLIAETGPLGGPGGSMPLSSYAMDVFFMDSRHGWLSSAKGDLLATNDGGTTWQSLPRLGDLTRISEVQFLTEKKGYIIATEVTNTVSSRLLTTSDGGKTWTQVYESVIHK